MAGDEKPDPAPMAAVHFTLDDVDVLTCTNGMDRLLAHYFSQSSAPFFTT